MASRIGKVLASVAEFISRFWPVSRTEEQVLEDHRRTSGSGGQATDKN